jgi:hypothetical protein
MPEDDHAEERYSSAPHRAAPETAATAADLVDCSRVQRRALREACALREKMLEPDVTVGVPRRGDDALAGNRLRLNPHEGGLHRL